MRFIDLIQIAFMNLWRRKLRAFLTVLGMVIGTSSIVVMVSLGLGIQQATLENYEGTGSLTNIRVSSWSYKEMENGNGVSKEKKLDQKAVNQLAQLPGVTAVMPIVETNAFLKCGKYMTWLQLMGVDADVAEEFGFTLADGRYPETTRKKLELVLGAGTLSNFYDPNSGKQAVDRDGNPKVTVDDRITLSFDYSAIYGYESYDDNGNVLPPGKSYDIEVVGTMSNESNDYSWYSLMDMDVFKKIVKENEQYTNMKFDTYQQVMVKCSEIDEVLNVKALIDEMGYGTYSLQDAVVAAQEQTKQIRDLLGAIGAVSLLIAAIGIMNTMMMSIYERTKEIGIIKVLGCRMSNIAGLFLTEAAYIGLFGGALGLGISYGISELLNTSLVDSGLRSIIPGYLAIGAVVFSIIVALISGLYPALRAMRLSPLSAIRNE